MGKAELTGAGPVAGAPGPLAGIAKLGMPSIVFLKVPPLAVPLAAPPPLTGPPLAVPLVLAAAAGTGGMS